MYLGNIENCEKVNDRRNRTIKSGNKTTFGEKENYKYIRIVEGDIIKQTENIEKKLGEQENYLQTNYRVKSSSKG